MFFLKFRKLEFFQIKIQIFEKLFPYALCKVYNNVNNASKNQKKLPQIISKPTTAKRFLFRARVSVLTSLQYVSAR